MNNVQKTTYILILFLTAFACSSETLLYEEKLPIPKIIKASFGKTTLHLQWTMKKSREKVEAYAFSYGIVGGKTLNNRMLIHTDTLAKGWKIENLEEGKEHWAKVQAVYIGFSGPWSDTIKGIMGKPNSPKNFKVAKNTKEAKWYVDVSWTNHPYNKQENLTIEKYILECWDNNTPTNHTGEIEYTESETGYYTANTKDTILSTQAQASYACSIRVKTDKGTQSEIVQKAVTFEDILKPELSSENEMWGTVITFVKQEGQTYTLNDTKDGVVTLDTTKNPAEIHATGEASGIVVIAERTGYNGTAPSDPITFRIQPGDTLHFPILGTQRIYEHMYDTNGNIIDIITVGVNVDDVDDTREIVYSISPTDAGASIDTNNGEVRVRVEAVGKTFTVTASKARNEQYELQSARYQLKVGANTDTNAITKPVLSTTSVPWGTTITFPTIAGHDYTLEGTPTGVRLRTNPEDTTKMQIDADRPVNNVVVVASRPGYTTKKQSSMNFVRKIMSSVPNNFRMRDVYQAGHCYNTASLLNTINEKPTGTSIRSINHNSGTSIATNSENKMMCHAEGGQSVVQVVLGHSGYEDKTVTFTFTVDKAFTPKPRPPHIAGSTSSWDSPRTITGYDSNVYEYRLHPPVSGVSIGNGKIHATGPRNNIRIQRRAKTTTTHNASEWSNSSASIRFTKASATRPNPPSIVSSSTSSWNSSRYIQAYNASVYEYQIYPSVSGVRLNDNRISSTDARNNVRIRRRTKATATRNASPWSNGSSPIRFITYLQGSVISVTGRGSDDPGDGMEIKGTIYMDIYENNTTRTRKHSKIIWWEGGDGVDISHWGSKDYSSGDSSAKQIIKYEENYNNYYVSVRTDLKEDDTTGDDSLGTDITKWELSTILQDIRKNSNKKTTRYHHASGEGNNVRITVEFKLINE